MRILIYLATCYITLIIMAISCNEKTGDCIQDPKEDCICTQQYQPVCGCDGITYGNACEAECAGVLEYTEGECGE